MATINVDDTCVGDGTTDDEPALSTIWAALNSGDVMEFGAGKTYAIGAPTSITSKSNVTINGNGATIKHTGAAVTDGNWSIFVDRCTGFAFSDLTIDGNISGRNDPGDHQYNRP